MIKSTHILAIILVASLVAGCSSSSKLTRAETYKGFYDEQPPLSILIMPPINRSTNVEAKEFFHSTLNTPIANAGYYVLPPFLTMEMLRRESAYDSELFLNSPLEKFGEVFGADLALFTIIHQWRKSGLAGKIFVEVEYIFKSTTSNEVLYSRRASVNYDTSLGNNSGFGLAGVLINLAATAINTAAIKNVDVARACNHHTFKDLPAGKYSPDFGIDGEERAGKKEFRVNLN